MCGLASILLYPKQRSPQEWDRIRNLFTQTLIFNEERGRDASGIALIRRNRRFELFKEPVPASQLVEMEPYQNILQAVDQDTVCLLGHTRLPTKGSRWNNHNNHPLLAGYTLGIHNGVIKNDDALFSSLSLPRLAEVDSEIIFRLLDTVSPAALNGRYLPVVRDKIRLLEGRLASICVDLRRPTQLLVIKRNNPLCMHYEPELQAIFFSSRYLFLRKAFGRSVITEALRSDSAYLFDAERLVNQSKQPIKSISL